MEYQRQRRPTCAVHQKARPPDGAPAPRARGLRAAARSLRLLHAESLLTHEARGTGNRSVLRLAQRLDHILLLFFCPVLAQLEFSLDPAYRDFESDNVAQHAFAIRIAQAGPLFAIRSLKRSNQLVQHSLNILSGGENSRRPVHMHCSIVPCRHILARRIVRRRYVRVRPVEDHHATRLLFEISPVRVSLGYVTANDDAIRRLPNHHRKMRREGPAIRRRDEDRERVRPHELHLSRVVSDAEMFRDVHSLSLSTRSISSPFVDLRVLSG